MKEAIPLRVSKKTLAAVCAAVILVSAAFNRASAWETNGRIPGTEIDYSNLQISKEGVEVRLFNFSNTDIKISLRLAFFDKSGNETGYSLFGLREIPKESYVDIAGNHLSGDWKACKGASRIEWRKMTYEFIYDR
jgi:uncharacterized protein YxeA